MSDIYTVLHSFDDPETAEKIGETLERNGIPYMLNDLSGLSGSTIAFNLQLKIKYTHLEEAEQALAGYYGGNMLETNPGNYLFDLASEELHEIVTNPARASLFEYQLSREILKSRGEEVAPREIRQTQKERFTEKLGIQKAPLWLIVTGYFFSVGGGIVGLIIGWSLIYSRRETLDGEKNPAFRPADRQHGVIMMVTSCIIIFLELLYKFNKK